MRQDKFKTQEEAQRYIEETLVAEGIYDTEQIERVIRDVVRATSSINRIRLGNNPVIIAAHQLEDYMNKNPYWKMEFEDISMGMSSEPSNDYKEYKANIVKRMVEELNLDTQTNDYKDYSPEEPTKKKRGSSIPGDPKEIPSVNGSPSHALAPKWNNMEEKSPNKYLRLFTSSSKAIQYLTGELSSVGRYSSEHVQILIQQILSAIPKDSRPAYAQDHTIAAAQYFDTYRDSVENWDSIVLQDKSVSVESKRKDAIATLRVILEELDVHGATVNQLADYILRHMSSSMRSDYSSENIIAAVEFLPRLRNMISNWEYGFEDYIEQKLIEE